MKALIIWFVVGLLVGVAYGAFGEESCAPIIALLGPAESTISTIKEISSFDGHLRRTSSLLSTSPALRREVFSTR
jgi:hypothetical protein